MLQISTVHEAAFQGDLSFLKSALTSSKRNYYLESKFHGHNIIHQAVSGNQLSMAKFLIKLGHNINSLNSTNTSPLHLASIEGNLAMVKLVVQSGANLHQRDIDGLSALHWAALRGHEKVVQYLINRGVLIYQMTRSGFNTLDLWQTGISRKMKRTPGYTPKSALKSPILFKQRAMEDLGLVVKEITSILNSFLPFELIQDVLLMVLPKYSHKLTFNRLRYPIRSDSNMSRIDRLRLFSGPSLKDILLILKQT